jgi:hypothetical protein
MLGAALCALRAGLALIACFVMILITIVVVIRNVSATLHNRKKRCQHDASTFVGRLK